MGDQGKTTQQPPPLVWRSLMYSVFGLATIASVGMTLYSMSLIDFFWPMILGLYGGALCLLAWFILSIIGLVTYRRVWPFVLAPVLVFGAIGTILAFDVPSRIQFTASKSALRDTAVTCTPTTDVRIGLYRVEEVAPHEGGCFFYLPGNFIDRDGIAVLPNGPYLPDQLRHLAITTTPISGDLYRFTWHF